VEIPVVSPLSQKLQASFFPGVSVKQPDGAYASNWHPAGQALTRDSTPVNNRAAQFSVTPNTAARHLQATPDRCTMWSKRSKPPPIHTNEMLPLKTYAPDRCTGLLCAEAPDSRGQCPVS
jgi:hypothetical protein